MSKKVNKLTEPNMRLYFLLAAVFCAVTLWIEPILGLVEAGVMALTYVYFRRTAQKRREGIQRYVEDMTDDVASAGKSSMLSAPFAMMVFPARYAGGAVEQRELPPAHGHEGESVR